MIFKEMDQEVVRKLLEGHKDIVSPESSKHEDYFRKLSCHRCGGSVHRILDPRRLFRDNDILPNYLARCSSCMVEFEPYTLIEVSLPKTR